MDSAASAALLSWPLDWRVIVMLLATVFFYWRGWLRGERDPQRLSAFVAGIVIVFLATESPLDAFDSLFLSAHMTQHLLLLMFAPPLILFGRPFVPLLRGLPRGFVKEALGPFLTWRPLRRAFEWLVLPVPAWLLFALSTVLWHVPALYELALSSRAWHSAQHASFFWTGIVFWWPLIEPGAGKSRSPQWIKIPYLLFADILNTAISAVFVFSNGLLYPSYAAIRAGQFGAQEDQTVAGLIMWVPGSIVYLIPACVLLVGLLSPQRRLPDTKVVRKRRPLSVRSRRWVSYAPQIRRAAQWLMLVVAALVIWQGWSGPQLGALNWAGVLPWIYWRALSLFALLVVGNLFCAACPFTLARDLVRKVIPPGLRWPRFLRSKWLPAGLIVVFLWAYEAFSLWDHPAWTAWMILGYFAAAILVDGVFRGASFCKYVCPIGQFHFVASLCSPREIAVKSPSVCRSCRTYDCIRGNETARGCELDLFQPKKAGNLDCTFCLDCVKACPHDNVALMPAKPILTVVEDPYRSSIGRLSKRRDWAALVLVVVFGGLVNAAGMIAPVMQWEHGWHARLGPNSMPWIVGAVTFVGAVLLPAAVLLLAAKVQRLIYMLVPVGIAIWASHGFFHLASNWGLAEIASTQILFLDAGLLASLYAGWRIACALRENGQAAGKVFVPWAALACVLYAAGAWIVFQPMQMRGMIH